ncbi:MAG: coproporphyrinogen III oxidase [Bacteroidetes bacterium]|nr:MAG: coproporphyrinogen III oxidase [Bacteroidota bacterium]
MIRDFIDGIAAYGRAFSIISRLNLWGYFVAPALISLVLALLIGWGAWGLSDDVGGWIASWYPWEWGRPVFLKIANVFGGLLVLALGLIAYKQLVMGLSAPIMSPLSERVEEHLTGRESTARFTLRQMLRDLVRGLTLALRNVIRELVWTVLLLLVGLIPGLQWITLPGLLLVQAYYFGFGNMDFTLERHLGVRDSIAFVRRNRALAIGNGAVTLALLSTLLGFLVVLPLGTVAATIETLKRLPVERPRRHVDEYV